MKNMTPTDPSSAAGQGETDAFLRALADFERVAMILAAFPAADFDRHRSEIEAVWDRVEQAMGISNSAEADDLVLSPREPAFTVRAPLRIDETPQPFEWPAHDDGSGAHGAPDDAMMTAADGMEPDSEADEDRLKALLRLESAVWTFMDFKPVLTDRGDRERLRLLERAAKATARGEQTD